MERALDGVAAVVRGGPRLCRAAGWRVHVHAQARACEQQQRREQGGVRDAGACCRHGALPVGLAGDAAPCARCARERQ
eukprot:1819332-Prymnesium_polylepis.1